MSSLDPRFKLKEPKSQKETLIYMKVYVNYKRITISLEKKIHPDAWDNEKGEPITDRKVIARLEKSIPGISSKIADIEKSIVNYRTALSKAVARLSVLEEEINSESIKLQTNKELGRAAEKRARVTLSNFIDKYINEIETGKRLTPGGDRFRNGTIKNYKGFQVQFKAFQSEKHISVDFDDVNIPLRDKLVSYFQAKNYSPNTIGRHIKQLKAIMHVAHEEGLHGNMDYLKRNFTIPQVITSEIYLSEDELDAIAGLDLHDKPHLDLTRDVFLVGCYTAQRYSDYSRISKEHIHQTPEGKSVIKLTQVKTGTSVVIPIRPALDKILAKYQYTLPKTYEQKVNLYIKDVVEMAKIDKSEQDEIYIKGKCQSKSRPKFEMVKTHTARRSGATNMYLAKVPVISIMRITGHKTEREFLKYIRITNQENANNLAEHPYFS